MIYVKTVYDNKYRLPDISKYGTDEGADLFIRTCLRWGIKILSCEKIDETEAKELLASGQAESLG